MVARVDEEPDEAAASRASAALSTGRLGVERERLRVVVDTHLPTVWRLLRRLGLSEADTDDAIQEAILVTARKLHVIELGRERAFLLRTSYRIGARLRARRAEVASVEPVDPRPSVDALVDQRRARELLDAILLRLGEELRVVLVLHEVEGMTMAEIAESLELSRGTVASRLRRAREQFERLVAQAEARMRSGGRSR